jgi:hypothetical protein
LLAGERVASLNASWPSYGTKPLSIDETTFCNPSVAVTYAALVANNADVLVLSDPAGAPYQFSPGEVSAIKQYAQAGHNVVATYLTLFWDNPDSGLAVDNIALAPILGLRVARYTGGDVEITPTYTIRNADNPLFRNLANPYVSSGYDFSQHPSLGTWTKGALNGARIVSVNGDRTAAILNYRACTYRAVYITNMPEYFGSSSDQQFLYNALTRSKPKPC